MSDETWYIAGPMTGKPLHNFPEFFTNELYLQEKHGVKTINPARHDIEVYPDIESWEGHAEGKFQGHAHKDFDFNKIGGWDAEQIMDPNTTGIALLRGWKDSMGATAEFHLATWFHKQIRYVDYRIDYFGENPHPHHHKIVGLIGLKGSGKDEAAKGLTVCGWTRVALADEVRAMALDVNPWISWDTEGDHDDGESIRLSRLVEEIGWDRAKNEFKEVRRLLQVLGTEAVRDRFGEEAWTKLAKKKINETEGPVVVTDVRFPNEADWIREHGGVVVKIERPGLQAAAPDKHRSEAQQAKVVPDYIIFNDGTIEKLQGRLYDLVNR